MRKQDLKVGMRVDLRSKGRGVIIRNDNGEPYVVGKNFYTFLNNDLTSAHIFESTEWDIVAVYKGHSLDLFLDINDTPYGFEKAIWKREDEVVELTIEQIEKLYGKKVKIIK